MPHNRLDDGDFPNPDMASFANRALEHVHEAVRQKKLRPLKGREWIAQDDSVEAWAETYVHQMYELLGVAEFVGDDVEDFPLAGESHTEETFNIRKLGSAFKHTFDEIEKSRALGRSLDEKRAEAALRAHEEKHNEVMWYGDQQQQLFGLLNYPDAPHVVLSDPINSNTGSTTIKNMITSLLVDIFKQTRHTAQPDTILMPTDPYFHIVDTEHNPSGGGDSTILEWIVEKHPFIDSEEDIDPVEELDDAGPNGLDMMVVGRFGDGNMEEVAKHTVPKIPTQRPPQQRNEAIITNMVSKTGGVASDFPQEFIVAEIPD